MLRRTFSKLVLSAILALSGVGLAAQTYGSYTPYSIFGVGDIATPGNAYNKSMGGVGIAGRSNRFINPRNPAAVTARDSLAFMADFSLLQDNKIFRQGDLRSASNTFNISNLIISFPIWRSSAMMVGIQPYSSTGYGYGYSFADPEIIGRTGNVSYTASGRGSIYQAFIGGGVTFWKRLSLGAEFIFHFGRIEKTFLETFSNNSYNGASNGHILQLSAPAGKFGIQYEQPVGTRSSIIVGGTYKTAAQLSGDVESYRYSTGSVMTDTLYHKKGVPGNVRLASEIGAGISYNFSNKMSVEFNYTRSDWSGCGLESREGFTGNLAPGAGLSVFGPALSESYRAGLYYKTDYFTVDGNHVNAYGITLGATLPIPPGHNGITLGMDFGQRGSIKDNMIRETYFNFSIGFNMFDIWFQKHQYQ